MNSSFGPGARDLTARATGVTWMKSSHSGPTGGNCVEVAFLAGGRVALRNSRRPGGPALTFTSAEWSAFLAGACDGEFDTPS